MMSLTYPWYELVEGSALEQGDVLLNCPVAVPSFPDNLDESLVGETLPARVQRYDVIVMTQSCDLAEGKVEDITLCPHWDMQEESERNPALRSKDKREAILKGRNARYSMLEACVKAELPMNIRIVDFGRVYSLPKEAVQDFAMIQGARLRLCPPYREHLSQAFARFFMRVGLPQDIQLP